MHLRDMPGDRHQPQLRFLAWQFQQMIYCSCFLSLNEDHDEEPATHVLRRPPTHTPASRSQLYLFDENKLHIGAHQPPALFNSHSNLTPHIFFSSPNSRKTCLFALSVIVVLLGIVEGVLSTVVQVSSRPTPRHSAHLFLRAS